MEKRTTSIIIAIVVVAVLAFSIYQFSGQSIYGGSPKDCLDTDSSAEYPDGLNLYEKGTVTYSNRDVEFTDYCIDLNELNEYYCINENKIDSTNKVCESSCEKGACVE